MTDTAITITAVLGFLAGAMFIGMWLGPALSRVRTERDRLQYVVDSLRAESDAMTDKIAQLTAECVEFQRLAHEAQELARMEKERADNLIQDCVVLGDIVRADAGSVAMLAAEKKKLEMAEGMIAGEMAAHRTTKRQLAAARGQITKLKRRAEG